MSATEKQKILQKALEDLIEPVCAAHGVELVEVRLHTQRGALTVRVMIDRPRPPEDDRPGSGVTLQDCTGVSRDLSTTLDVHDGLIGGAYHLEVSSPGLDRPLVKPSDFDRFRGHEVKVKTSAPVAERKSFRGVLLGIDGDLVALQQDGSTVRIPFEAIAKANLVPQL